MKAIFYTAVLSTMVGIVGCAEVPPSYKSPQSRTDRPDKVQRKQISMRPESQTRLPRPDHIVVVIEENKSFAEIAGSPDAPYIHHLMKAGANLTAYHAVSHPSQPNYLALFSGSTQGVTSDSCPHQFTSKSLGGELISAHLRFAGYSEDLPGAGYTGCTNVMQTYARKHNPWVNFQDVPAKENLPAENFGLNFAKLPTVSFLIPNLIHDMHSASIGAGDEWLKNHVQPYVEWAMSHNSLLIVTWDEDDESSDNHIPTFLVGPMVNQGNYGATYNHYNLLRTIEDFYHLAPLAESKKVRPITGMWK